MTVIIKKASLDVLDKLHEIERKSFREEAFTRSQIAILLTDRRVIAFTASVDEEIVGFVIALVEAIRKPFGHIITIDVLPQQRKKGIGERLLQAIETKLREKSVNECRLEVREDNVAALALYMKNGYTIIGRLDGYYGIAHGLYLRKKLAPERFPY